MAAKKAAGAQITQAERLKEILKGMGIHSEKDLDKALEKVLNGLMIGIMTDPPIHVST